MSDDALAHWRAADGTPLTLRLMRSSDAPRLKIALGHLSPEARRSRFFAEVPEFTDAKVRELTDFDPQRVFALIVVRSTDGEEWPVAGGRLVVADDAASCEISLLVGDRWQGQGIGRRLLAALTREAARRRIPLMTGHVLAENRTMLLLARAYGFQVGDSDEGPAVKRIYREIAPTAPVGWLGRLRRLFGSSG